MNTSGSDTPALIGIGDLVADVVVHIPTLPVTSGDFFLADAFEVEAGGTANFLIMAARLGAPAVAMGSVGADRWGSEVAEILQSEGVDLSLVSPAGTTTRALVLVDEEGNHAFAGKFGEGESIQFGQAYEDALKRAGGIFASGYSLGEEHLAELTLQVMRAAGKMGVLRAFDPGPAFAGITDEVQIEALSLTDILLVNEEELQGISPEGIEALFEYVASMVVLKLGSGGCEIYQADGHVVRSPGFSVPVVDTTAAGDSFAAAFLRGLTAGLSVQACALFANAVGASKVQKLGGGRNVPLKQEVETLLAASGLDYPSELK